MMGKTHQAGGLLIASAVAGQAYNKSILVAGLSLGVLVLGSNLGSLLCDIDKKESKIGRRLWFISWPIYLVGLFINIIKMFSFGKLKRMLNKVSRGVNHRGLAHSLLTWGVLSVFFYLISNNIIIEIPAAISFYLSFFLFGVSIGMLSHIFLDLLNGGEALFYPISDKNYAIARIPYNGVVEKIIRISMYAGTACCFYFQVTNGMVLSIN